MSLLEPVPGALSLGLGLGESPRQGCWESLMRDLGAPHKCPPSLPRQARAPLFCSGNSYRVLEWILILQPHRATAEDKVCVCVCVRVRCDLLCDEGEAMAVFSVLRNPELSQLYHTLTHVLCFKALAQCRGLLLTVELEGLEVPHLSNGPCENQPQSKAQVSWKGQ